MAGRALSAQAGRRDDARAMPGDGANYLRPTTVERMFSRAMVLGIRIGAIRGHFHILEVRGRKSGRTISLPVDPIEVDERRYLVCARGESQWVRNARAAGEIVLVRAMRRQPYALREVPADLRRPVLKAYLDQFAAEVQRFFAGTERFGGGRL